MPNIHHITEFSGLPVVEFPGWDTVDREYQRMVRDGTPVPDPYPPHAALAAALADAGSVAWRLRTELPYSSSRDGRLIRPEPVEDLSGYLERFAEEVDLSAVRALVVGNIPGDDFGFRSEEVRDRLIALAPKLTDLRALFFGEIVREENEISWIHHCDLAPLLAALPQLTEFTVRGGSGDLELRIGEHTRLRRLTVQSGGLRPEVIRDVCASSLPELEHLELWLGDEEYGGGTTTDDLAPLLSGEAFPRLRHLGLRNSDRTGDWVRALADAPVTARLDTLDLSLGTLRDEDVDALLDAPAFRNLNRLDLHHHYLSQDNTERVRAALTDADVETDLSGPRQPDVYDDEDGEDTEVYYYTAVAE